MYFATEYSKPNRSTSTRVIIDENNESSIETMWQLINEGYKCKRFITDSDAYNAFMEGKELTSRAIKCEIYNIINTVAVVI